jgi:hypothetical protein
VRGPDFEPRTIFLLMPQRPPWPEIAAGREADEFARASSYRWFCRLDLDDGVPDHSTFSKNRHGRFRESDVLRHVFERVVGLCIAEGLVKGETFAVDASFIQADASRYHKEAPETIGAKSKSRRVQCVNISTRSMKPVAWRRDANSQR